MSALGTSIASSQQFLKVNALSNRGAQLETPDRIRMRIADIDHIVTNPAGAGIERIVQTAQPLATASLLVMSVLATAGVLVPFGMVAAHAASDPAALAALAGRPASTILVVCGLLLALGLVAVPLRAALARLSRRRAIVTFADGRVQVEEHGLIGAKRWSARTGEFKGIAQHVRATLSGARHELILVHADRSKDILLQIASRPADLTLEGFARMIGVTEVPARELYGRRRSRGADAGGFLELTPAPV